MSHTVFINDPQSMIGNSFLNILKQSRLIEAEKYRNQFINTISQVLQELFDFIVIPDNLFKLKQNIREASESLKESNRKLSSPKYLDLGLFEAQKNLKLCIILYDRIRFSKSENSFQDFSILLNSISTALFFLSLEEESAILKRIYHNPFI